MRALLQAIARGAAWKLGADLLGRALQYALLWVAARSLGRADYGDFTFGLTVGLMLAQVADFGLQLFVQRELARLAVPGASNGVYPERREGRPYFTDEAAASRLIGGGLVIKLGLSVVAMALMAGLVLLEPVDNKGALLLIGLSMVLATGLDYVSYCFRAVGRLKNEALAWLLARAMNLALGLGALFAGAGIWGLAVAGNLAMVAALGFGYASLLNYVRPTWRPEWAYWRRMLGQPTAIGVGVIFSIISFRVDNLLIPPFSGREALGLYNVAYKLFEPSQMLPATLLAATFPLISQAAMQYRVSSTEYRVGQGNSVLGTRYSALRTLLAHNLSILLGLAVAVTLALLVFAGPVVHLLYGTQYAESAPILRILALACVPMYLNYALTHALIAMDKPRLYAIFTLLTIFVNVGANLTLLPILGVQGAAWATAGTELALLALCSWAVYRLLKAPAPIAEHSAEGRVESSTSGGAN